ncbi:MAG: hypothetical protein AAF348_18740 [Bacteroidota bacterium]
MWGYIKLRRSLKEWEWYSDHNATRLLVHLLITVNYERKKWQGITIEPGSRVFSWENLSNELGMSVQNCRTAMKKLETSKEINRQLTGNFQLVALLKWDKMQIENVSLTANQQQNQQVANRPLTTTKERKESKEDVVNRQQLIIDLFDLFETELKDGSHDLAIEGMYLSTKLKKGTIGKLLPEFKAHILTQNKLHGGTIELRSHLKSWLDKRNQLGQLNGHKKPEHRS